MPKICTLGSRNKRTQFSYDGSVEQGTKFYFSGQPFVSHQFYSDILEEFNGKVIPGGFSMTNPIRGGLGEWVQNHSDNYGRKLTPRHATFIAAILVHEGYITSSLKGNKIMLDFRKGDKKLNIDPNSFDFEKYVKLYKYDNGILYEEDGSYNKDFSPTFNDSSKVYQKRGYLKFEEFLSIAMWKTPRQERNYKKNSKEMVESVTRTIMSIDEDRERLSLLSKNPKTKLKGVMIPVASAILTAIYPNR